MPNSLKSQDIANKLGVTTHTIRRWVARFPEYFSDGAKKPYRNQSVYTSDDLKIILTIAELAQSGTGLKMIEYELSQGYRYEGSLEGFSGSATKQKFQYKNKAVETLEERMMELTQKQAEVEILVNERITELTKELMETKYKLGVAEGKLELLQSKNA